MTASSSNSTPIYSNTSSSTPTPKFFLQKVRVLRELKSKFTSPKVELEQRVNDCATTSILNMINKPYEKIIEEKFKNEKIDCTLADLKNLTETLIKNECSYPEAVVAYHGNKSSLISDIFGMLVSCLEIEEAGHHRSLPRLFPHVFESNIQNFLTTHLFIDDHSHNVRETLVSASPSLFSVFESRQLENALVFYAFGSSVATESSFFRISNLLTKCDLSALDMKTLSIRIAEIESSFPQNGYIHQIFFQTPEIANLYTYPSLPFGEPLISPLKLPATTDEFLSALQSKDSTQIENFQSKYNVSLGHVQLRILAHPKIFQDKKLTTTHCFRKIKFDEKAYFQKIQKDIIDPIIESWLTSNLLNGSFALSPLVNIAGSETPALAKLADYVFTDMSNPVASIIYGDEESVLRALRSQELSPLTVFWTGITALELSLIAGQKNIFNRLFKELKNSKIQIPERLVENLLLKCLKINLKKQALYFLNLTNDFHIIQKLIIYSCNDNDRNLILAGLNRLLQIGKTETSRKIADVLIPYCLKSSDFECLDIYVKNFREIEKNTNVLNFIIEYVPPYKFSEYISLFENYGFDLKALERKILYAENSMPISYRIFYKSLSPNERLSLPLQRWWEFQFENCR